MPAFSAAISSSRSPSMSQWSSPIEVITATSGCTTLVASSRPLAPPPPRPRPARPRELQKSHGRHELKKSGPIVGRPAQFVRHGLQFVDVGHDLLLAEQLAVHLHALAQLYQMRGGVQAGAPAGRMQHGVQHRRHRSLAVRPGDMDHRVAPLGMAERRDEEAHPVDAEFHPSRLEAEKVVLNRRVAGECS